MAAIPLLVSSDQGLSSLLARYPLQRLAEAPASGFFLRLDEQGLALCQVGHNSQVRVDFVAGRLAYRRLHGGSEAVVRAVGVKPGQPLSVVDGTAGLGRDAFILAAHGARVTMVERQPLLAALLDDGLRRAQADADTVAVAERLTLIHAATLATLEGWGGEQPAVVYLDPMFPHRRKSALVKQDMQWLQQVVGGDDDADLLLLPARRLARQRVVVKRPEGAPPLAGVNPSGAVTTRGHRFDIYAPVS